MIGPVKYCLFFLLLITFSCNVPSPDKGADYPCLVQVIITDAATETSPDFYALARTVGIRDPLLYQWKNHHILYGTKAESERFYKSCLETYPMYAIQLLEMPFYTFDRKHCKDEETAAKKIDHVLLSANLVKDSILQQEYLDYHTQQFEHWPEVSVGFCKAMFQQVFLYKSGRQLLLVINIPKGADFKRLDKRTVENNPRVDVWNRRMAKYQEGLTGTDPDETWVFFKKEEKR